MRLGDVNGINNPKSIASDTAASASQDATGVSNDSVKGTSYSNEIASDKLDAKGNIKEIPGDSINITGLFNDMLNDSSNSDLKGIQNALKGLIVAPQKNKYGKSTYPGYTFDDNAFSWDQDPNQEKVGAPEGTYDQNGKLYVPLKPKANQSFVFP